MTDISENSISDNHISMNNENTYASHTDPADPGVPEHEFEAVEAVDLDASIASDTAFEYAETAPAYLSEQPEDSVTESVEDTASETAVSPEPPVILTRIERLTRTIERYPDAPANYVYRGEAYLAEKDYFHAAADFNKAVAIADAQAEIANWGYIYRALADRAREGLRRIRL